MKTAVINSRWLAFANLRMDAQFWTRVSEQLKQDDVQSPESATDEEVKVAIAKVAGAD